MCYWSYLIKMATTSYRIEGEGLQGVGLRKHIHELLGARGLGGLAVNDPETGGLELDVSGTEENRTALLKDILRYASSKGAQANVSGAHNRPRVPVNMTASDIRRFFEAHGLQYSPTDALKRKWLKDRFRLKDLKDGLEGSVSPLAAAQIKAEAPVFKTQRTAPELYGLTNVFAPRGN
jgi:acylphosphatase